VNTFQQISRELVVEDLQKNKALHSTIASDPVKRQLTWRRICGEQAGANGLSQKAVTGVTQGNHQLSLWKRMCLCVFQKILGRGPEY